MKYQAHPLRIQLSRKKGSRKPEGAVVVSRPSKWGNPWTADICGSRVKAVIAYRKDIESYLQSGQINRVQFLYALQGRQLACWCPLDQPCHADVLCELANPGGPAE
jgi:hypothetical protein